MKKLLIVGVILFFAKSVSQEHFSGINTSQRIGIVNAGINPAELANLSTTFEINIFAASVKASSNKVGFSDLLNSSNLEALQFSGAGASSLSFDGEINGPGIAYKMNNWGFAFTTKAYAKLDVVAVDSQLGTALSQSIANSFLINSSQINSTDNQRLNGTSWGEIGLGAARNLYDDSEHKFNVGVTFKLLFPGSYANFGADKFNGTVNNNLGNLTLTNTFANLNIAYSGNLGDDYSKSSDYFKSLYGKLNGVAADLGANYQWKDTDGQHYKVNVGLALKNIGGMTFKSNNNAATNYTLSIQGSQSLNLNQFQNATSLKEIERLLLASGYLNKTNNDKKDFKVKLPTIFTAYADFKIIPSFYATLYTQQKLKNDADNDQITSQNIVSLTPRYTLKNYEVFLPFSHSEVSGIAGGIGFRAYGFYLGSGSIITALISDTKQADAYFGYGFKLD
ncbi:MAG: hypothetical protein H7199_03815 [Burkholderiales bacterium]|nr:hypothetical protein [Flavobacterium sp.]